jgi:16S rRNA (guanine(1405)-N(7))-methyltransferase
MGGKDDPDLAQVVNAVRAGAKYSRIAEEFTAAVARRELGRRRSLKETVKAVRNKLHQVGGAYLAEDMRYATWLEALKDAAEGQDPQAFKEVCLRVMRLHASTRERLSILESFYGEIFAALPPVHSVLDAASGLNPLSIPWMALPPGAEYTAVDIYQDMMDFLGEFFLLMGIRGRALAADVLEMHPQPRVDLALVLKAVPCLEQVDRTSGERLLSSLNASAVLVSFPVHSLGGREKGMAASYEKRFDELAAALGWTAIQRFVFPSELAFLVRLA